ncbi:TPA: hypothetical protein ACGXM3_005215 [Bacillus cereus]
MNKELIHDYISAKRGKKNMKFVLHRVLNENKELNNKFLKLLENNSSLDVIAKELNVMGIVVEILAKANKKEFIYATHGTYIR